MTLFTVAVLWCLVSVVVAVLAGRWLRWCEDARD
jgi:hypothetical protein